jgi:hypothetical protein
MAQKKYIKDIKFLQPEKLENNIIKNDDIIKNNDILKNNSSSSDNLVSLTNSPTHSPTHSDISPTDNNLYLKELLKNQLKNISSDKKLNYNDIKRISKFLSCSIFDKNNCCIWDGYITNEKNQSKGTYINFYFNKKKIALHRLLYINYVEDMSPDEYIKFSCVNKGKCCNVNHMQKFIYNKNIDNNNINQVEIDIINNKSSDKINKNIGEHISINTEKKKLIIEL